MIKVVQCRDCKDWMRRRDSLITNRGICRCPKMVEHIKYIGDSIIWLETDADFYCSYGERKEKA